MPEPSVRIEVDEETGRWSVDGQPMLLIPRHFWVFVQMACERRFGIEATRAVLHDATYRAARVWCEREARTHAIGGEAVFRHYLDRMGRRGYGRFTIEALDAAAGTATVSLDHSVYVAEYGQVGRPVCYMFNSAFVGALEGVVEAAGRGLALDCDETECAAAGAPCCRFSVRPKP